MVLMNKRIQVIQDTGRCAPDNMAIDEVLFNHVIEDSTASPILRLYSFTTPSITVGCFQTIKGEHSLKERFHEYPSITRRITGGGIVYHENDITFTVISRTEYNDVLTDVRTSYKFIHTIVHRAFNNLGYVCLFEKEAKTMDGTGLCFEHPVTYDLLFNGKKVAGGAQRRKHKVLLHQGSIALTPFITKNNCLRELTVNMKAELIQSAKEAFDVDADERELYQSELDAAMELKAMKYEKEHWVFRR